MIKASSKRIIFIPFVGAFGGAERLIIDLSRFLHDIDVPHTLVCFKQTIDLQAYSDRPLDVHELLPKRNSLLEAKALNRFLKLCQSDEATPSLLFDLKSAFYSGITSAGPFVLHLTDPPSLLPADISKYAPSARQLAQFSGPTPVKAARAMRAELVHRLNRRGVRRASKVIVMTERIQTELRDLYGINALVVRPGVSDVETARTSPHIASACVRILSVSRLERNKRIDWILQALAVIDAQKTTNTLDWKFEVVGDGPENGPLKRLATELGLQDRAIFLGHISDDDLTAAYARANLFLMPAVQGYGLPALEALSRGIPTIVHKDSGVSEILTGSPWVEIVDGANGSLTKAITVMLDRLKKDELVSCSMPALPTNVEWAKAICRACGWLPASMV